MGAAEDAAIFEAAAAPAVLAAAEAIADDWRRGAAQHELQTADRKTGVVVERVDGVTHVQTHNPFGHLDEFGSVHNPPTGAARSAANAHGTFTPYPKP